MQVQHLKQRNAGDDDLDPLCEDIYAHSPMHSSPTSIPAITPAWYKEHLSRDAASRLLKHREVGSFVVRRSAKRDCFALSLTVPPKSSAANVNNIMEHQPSQHSTGKQHKVVHYLIEQTNKEFFRIKGFGKEFQTLQALVTHHSVMKEKLPVALRLERTHNADLMNNNDNHSRRIEDYDDFEDLEELIRELNLGRSLL